MALTNIPSGFGSGGVGLYPEKVSGVPALETLLNEHKDAIEGCVKLTSLRVQHSDLTAAGNGDAQVLNIGSVLPAGAWVVGHQITLATEFSGGGATAVTVVVGGTVANGIIAGPTDVFTGAGNGVYSGTAGVLPIGIYGGQQLAVTFDVDAGHSLAGLTAGDLTISILYVVPQ